MLAQKTYHLRMESNVVISIYSHTSNHFFVIIHHSFVTSFGSRYVVNLPNLAVDFAASTGTRSQHTTFHSHLTLGHGGRLKPMPARWFVIPRRYGYHRKSSGPLCSVHKRRIIKLTLNETGENFAYSTPAFSWLIVFHDTIGTIFHHRKNASE